VVERSMGQKLTREELGGADIAVAAGGTIDNVVDTEDEALEMVRRFLSYMPQNVWELPARTLTGDPVDRCDERLATIVPRHRRTPYDMRRLINMVVDDGSTFEIQPNYGRSVITSLARLNGYVVGIVANNPMGYGMAGMAACDKAGLNLKVAWPSAEIGNLPVEGGVKAAFRREIEEAADPALREAEIEKELKALASPMRMAEAFALEDMIDPRETRPYLSRMLEAVQGKLRSTVGPKFQSGVRP